MGCCSVEKPKEESFVKFKESKPEEPVSEEQMVTEWRRKRLMHQQYRIVGNHSAVKICYWCKKSMKDEGHCYKHDFYGIDTLNCLEMSPAITCNQRCKHCWRDTSVFSRGWVGPVDDPKSIVEGCLKERTNLLIGFKGNDKVPLETFENSLKPTHAAISLTGEPCMYPRLHELVKEFFDHEFKTVFLVTSGTVPEMLENFKTWQPPTNIYLSLEAPNEEDYIKFCIPTIDNAYDKIKQSQEVLRDIRGRCRTVMRITCVKGFNMHKVNEFVEHVQRMQPDVVECKGYMYMGYSMKRLEKENSPTFEEVEVFAKELAKLTGYEVHDQVEKSTIVMLTRKGYEEDYPK